MNLATLPSGPIEQVPTNAPFHAVWALLEAVTDPEIPVVSLRDMGILRAVRQGPEGLEVVITPTYSGCPAMGQMEDDVKAALAQAGLQGRVLTQLAPAWSTDWMTAQARTQLKAYGIAPPQASSCAQQGFNVLQFSSKMRAGQAHPAVVCPQCDSQNTTEISHFASTACKALYRCLNCLEPFDYFKPY